MGENVELERKVIKPSLGKIKLLHQIFEGEDYCLYCRKPSTEWEPMEECKTRYK